MPPRDETDPQARLRAALAGAMRGRNRVATSALRSVLSAISNAEAVVPASASPATTSAHAPGTTSAPAPGTTSAPAPGTTGAHVAGTTSAHVAGAAAGLGAAEAGRRSLTSADIGAIVQAEIGERLAAARGYEESGHPDRADRLRAEAGAIAAALPDISPPGE